MSYIKTLGAAAKSAVLTLSTAPTEKKNAALKNIAEALIKNTEIITAQNAKDIENAEKNGMTAALIDRLRLSPERIKGIADSVFDVIALPDPVGEIVGGGARPNGMIIEKVRVPLGVVAIIFESRPNVTVDAAVLCLKSGNCCILRGGKEAYNSNKILCEIMRSALNESGLPADCVCFVDDITRETATELMKCREYVDVLIPRGGAGLINAAVKNAAVPVIETGVGNCHLYVDKSADIDMAVSLAFNSKCRRPSVCNAIETLLVHKDIAPDFLPKMKEAFDRKNVEIRGDEKTAEILGTCVVPVTEEDFFTEFLDYIIAVKVVESTDEAIEHIAKYSTKHSECIVTNSLADADKFKTQIDSAAVYVNAATSFTDGGMFGLGAEIGISTQKMHARGPMGLRELTTIKYLISGNGQIRE
ncbi:MAG: glutamate-5-semialdehyde dehydrogenase [Ruminococcus sp.]|jgi:glutamate-5-semialdehyde dehydrogenase|nr:glutamate-5-semialdehyde dehydrogenase [Ruminococcus sp.]